MSKKKAEKKAAPKITSKKKYLKSFLFALLGFIVVGVVFAYLNTAKWVEPRAQRSQNGTLEVDLTPKESLVTIGNEQKTSRVYNEEYPGSTWVVKGGDTIKVYLKNGLSHQPTNLHFHGAHVSPKGNSDNVLLSIDPGQSFEYEYNLPENHPPGLYWYHPHMHPVVEDQVLGGMAGAIVVRGDIDELPLIKDKEERLLVLTTQNTNDKNRPLRLVNGQHNPTLTMRPGEIQRWRVLNASADDFYNFTIPGYKLHIISRDGNTLSRVDIVDQELISPGDRIEFLIQAKWLGETTVDSAAFKLGPDFDFVKDSFMKVKVAGIPRFAQMMPTDLIPFENLKDVKVDKTRTLTFGSKELPNGEKEFLLDGKAFNAGEISQVMTLGTTEEWQLVNDTPMWHPFHIHINPFQVVAINGQAVDRLGYDDTFGIPPKSTVTMRTQYKDFDGKYVLHCHILFHEDHGMMQVVEVVKPGAQQSLDNGYPKLEKMLDHSMHH